MSATWPTSLACYYEEIAALRVTPPAIAGLSCRCSFLSLPYAVAARQPLVFVVCGSIPWAITRRFLFLIFNPPWISLPCRDLCRSSASPTRPSQMARLPPGVARPNHDRRRRISLSDFLYLAMVCFVSPKEPEGRPRGEGSVSASGCRVYHGGGGSGGVACDGSRKMGQACTTNDHDDGSDVPSPASSLASGYFHCYRPRPPPPKSTSSSGGGESDPATIETEQSTERGSAFSLGKKLFVGDDVGRCSDAAAERCIRATPKALEIVATKVPEASALVRFVTACIDP